MARSHALCCRRAVSRRILFIGDSYIRHAFSAFLSTLSTDYEFGGLADEAHTYPHCAGEGQYNVRCHGLVPENATLCNGSVFAELRYGAWPIWTERDTRYDTLVWGAGNHPPNLDYVLRPGVNNASYIVHAIVEPTCSRTGKYHISWLPKHDAASSPRVFWLATHCRLDIKFPDEVEDRILSYNHAMSRALDDLCGVPTIDTLDMTCALVHQLPVDAANMTWDSAHWARAVNLLKAQRLLWEITRPGYGRFP